MKRAARNIDLHFFSSSGGRESFRSREVLMLSKNIYFSSLSLHSSAV